MSFLARLYSRVLHNLQRVSRLCTVWGQNYHHHLISKHYILVDAPLCELFVAFDFEVRSSRWNISWFCSIMSKPNGNPRKILLFSGKRKSGKDYITDRLYQLLNSNDVALIRISGPIKAHWGKEFNLDVDLLLSSSEFKERYRKEMVSWSEEIRKSDYGYFCRASLDMYDAFSKHFWIVADIRRKTDIKWFTENFKDKIKTIRVVCEDETRIQRGWKFTEGIDDAETECDLDDFGPWNQTIVNNGQDLEEVLKDLASDLTC